MQAAQTPAGNTLTVPGPKRPKLLPIGTVDYAAKKLFCGLESGIPIEEEWAYDILTTATFRTDVITNIVQFPNLVTVLLRHIQSGMDLNSIPFSDSAQSENKRLWIPDVLQTWADQGQERARRAVAIFRNLTFTPFNAQVLGEDSQFVQTLLRVCALVDEHRVCAQQALEALYNCAKYIPLTAGSAGLLANIASLICRKDASDDVIVTGLATLSRLSYAAVNLPHIERTLSPSAVALAVDRLGSQNQQLYQVAIDYLYAMAGCSRAVCQAVATPQATHAVLRALRDTSLPELARVRALRVLQNFSTLPALHPVLRRHEHVLIAAAAQLRSLADGVQEILAACVASSR